MNAHKHIDEYYKQHEELFHKASLTTIFGDPASGKTFAIQRLLPRLLANRANSTLTIIDGKGCGEWEHYKNVIDGYEDLEAVRDFFKSLADSVRYQLQSGETENHLVIVDESLTIFDRFGRSRESFDLLEEINKHITYVVKRARPTGVRIVLMSQRATFESIPTHVLQNASIRIAFRLEDEEREHRALGWIAEPSPSNIDYEDLGLAVVKTEVTDRELVQF